MSLRPLCLVAALFICATASPAHAQRLSQLATPPDWTQLEAYHETITRDEFTRLLDTVYAPGGAWRGMLEVRDDAVLIRKTLTPPDSFILRFARDAKAARRIPRTWRPAARLGWVTGSKPLAGLRLALDPGHLGGAWGLMEERSFARPGDAPVQEGDLTLRVARHVAARARVLGADVMLVRNKPGPVTPFKVDSFHPAARKELELLGVAAPRETYDGPRDPQKADTVQWQAERLFYRVAEIRERARRVEKWRPDVVVCIHFNADEWSDPAAPVFTGRNDVHVLVHGCYSASELRFDDQRFDMLVKLLNRSHPAELAAAIPVATALAKHTGLPPFAYATPNAVRAGTGELVWARNLLANRLYACPVIFLEPYRMNHAETYARIQAGDYEGTREFAGRHRESIVREYAGAVIEGLRDHYETQRLRRR